MNALAAHADDYLALRRALGHELAEARRLLPRFVAYLEETGTPTLTVAAAVAWSTQADPATTTPSRRMTVARGFARHMAGIDPATEVPPAGLLASRARWRPPFIYSRADIDALIAQVSSGSTQFPLRVATYQTLIGLLAVTGMRVGEAIRLDRADVDLVAGNVLVRQSKFGKSRHVPLHPSTVTALADYARTRDDLLRHPTSDPAFFVSLKGKRLLYAVVQEVFRNLCHDAGVGVGSSTRPRLHDLRHTFAVRTLVEWYRTGQDVNTRLPVLSTYLGHHDPRSTYWYLSAAPELLTLAAGRLANASPDAVTP